LVLAACRLDLDSPTGRVITTPPMCEEGSASTCVAIQPTLDSIQANMFDKNCVGGGCHDGGNSPQGRVDLRDGMSYAHLVNVPSLLQPTRKLVVPGDPPSSYLLVMIGKIAPEDATPPAPPIPASVGLMPQSGGILCCQKLDAVDAWIAA